ncbi:MAG: hypothetical protein AAF727_16355 [Pseudomonadota bacterium]
MKPVFLTTTALVATICATTLSANPTKIRKAADFERTVVGKTLNYSDGTFIRITPGKLSGKMADGRNIVGAWNWQGRFFCRNVKIGNAAINADCQAVTLEGDIVTFIRDKGRGRALSATLK